VTLEAPPDRPSATAPAADVGGAGVAPRHRHTARWIAVVVLVVTAALIALLATRPSASATEVYTPLLGKGAPALTGTTATGGRFDLATDRGRWVVVNFFASWCPPCQDEAPGLVTFAYQHRAAGDAVLVGVIYDDATSSARNFDTSVGATWPAVVDPGGQIALRYGVRGPPETFLISPAGIVVAHFDGAIPGSGFLDRQLAAARAAGL
jgi:cytochrome c biogenesis protein CcmG/thiol:disulfide interchange protein DsbE